MNTFSSLNPETNNEEIDGEKEYRKVKKKIRRLNEKDLLTEEQEEKLKKLKILVEEYESRHKGIPKKKPQPKKKQKKNNKEEEDLLNREYEKNRDYWKKKEREDLERELRKKWQKEQEERERKLKEEWEREHKQKEQQHKWEQQKREQQRNNNYNYQNKYTYKGKSAEEKFCENYNIEVPQDIKELYRNYSTKKYRELALKYHPDKGNKNIEYQKMINNIKDLN